MYQGNVRCAKRCGIEWRGSLGRRESGEEPEEDALCIGGVEKAVDICKSEVFKEAEFDSVEANKVASAVGHDTVLKGGGSHDFTITAIKIGHRLPGEADGLDEPKEWVHEEGPCNVRVIVGGPLKGAGNHG
jgi:hypothetical protein